MPDRQPVILTTQREGRFLTGVDPRNVELVDTGLDLKAVKNVDLAERKTFGFLLTELGIQ